MKEFIGQSSDIEGTRVSLNSGALLLTGEGTFRELPAEGAQELLTRPHIIHILRESALKSIGAWSSSIFVYRPPLVCFSMSEQKLLNAALQGGTDEEFADDLAISLSAIKKAWCSIHERAAKHLPDTVMNLDSQPDRRDGDRGKQKKQRLLAICASIRKNFVPTRRNFTTTKARATSIKSGRAVPGQSQR